MLSVTKAVLQARIDFAAISTITISLLSLSESTLLRALDCGHLHFFHLTGPGQERMLFSFPMNKKEPPGSGSVRLFADKTVEYLPGSV
jgi:hypothetical protein